jgi:hypothetical protein
MNKLSQTEKQHWYRITKYQKRWHAWEYQCHIPDHLELENTQQNVVPNDASNPIGVAIIKKKMFSNAFLNEKALIWGMEFQRNTPIYNCFVWKRMSKPKPEPWWHQSKEILSYHLSKPPEVYHRPSKESTNCNKKFQNNIYND